MGRQIVGLKRELTFLMLRSDLLVSMMVWRSAGILRLLGNLMNVEIAAIGD